MSTGFEHFIGTREVSSSKAFDQAALQVWLSSHLEDFDGPLRVELFKGGQSNPTYKLTTPRRMYVMRTKPAPGARLMPSAHAIEREFKVMHALQGRGVPVPRVFCLCDDESVIGRAFYLMEFLAGQVLWDPTLPTMSGAQRAHIYDGMNRTIAALHTVDIAAAGLADYGRPGNYFTRQIERWSKQYLATAEAPLDAMGQLMDWLPRNLPPTAADDTLTSVVHGDYRLDNLMFDPVSLCICAVLDWELSTLGHPLADFSYHCMAWHIGPGAYRGMLGADLDALQIPSARHYLQTYCERTGLADPSQLEQEWGFYLAYNAFRLAAITQGIAKRAADGTASSDRAATEGSAVAEFASLGWAFAQGA